MLSRLKENLYAQLFIIYLRYLLGGAFVFASIIKLKGKRFTSANGELEPINTAWHFFETMYHSGVYWKFIGLGQLIAGGLLMTQHYSKLGALLNLPIVANIFVITISYYFAFTPVITGAMLLSNLILLYWHSDELRVLINKPIIPDNKLRLEHSSTWELTGLAMFLFTVVYRVFIDEYDPMFWGCVCASLGLIGLVVFSLNSRYKVFKS